MKKYRIIIAGGRDFLDYMRLKTHMDCLIKPIKSEEIEIISGTANGADRLGERYAAEKKYNVMRFPADWDTYGKSAGMRRNAEMAKYASYETGILVAFYDGKSRGTKNMIETGKRYGLWVEIVNY